MRKIYFATMILGSLFTVSCSENIYDEPAQEEYSQNFIQMFGLIDKDQDWNTAGQKSVTVTGADSEVKVYAKSDDVYKLVGHYQNVANGQELTFDAQKDVDDFVVASGGKARLVKNGGTADFTSATSRSYTGTGADGVFAVNEEEYQEFSLSEVMSFAGRVPEGADNTNAPGITSNFSVVQDDRTITVYPVYWNASYAHMLGIYWTDENGVEHTQDIYQDKQGDEVQIDFGDGQWINATEKESTKDANGNTAQRIRSKGFTINLPAGTRYGFYVKVLPTAYIGYISNTYYSEAAMNPNNESHASYFTTLLEDGQYRTFLGFEDMPNDAEDGDKDLNDFMLIIDPSPVVIDEDAADWVIASEDLGGTDDYDFNDIVFSVNHVSGETTATVTPLAAGGTKSAWIYRDGTLVGEEIHSWLSGGNPQSSAAGYEMINTCSEGPAGTSVTIEVPADFSMAYCAGISNMGGFSIRVDDNSEADEITAPGKGEAPQMFCVPAGWKWPKERVSISEAYPEFGEWGANYQVSQWYNYPDEEKVLDNSH